jgi:hypothetical protein
MWALLLLFPRTGTGSSADRGVAVRFEWNYPSVAPVVLAAIGVRLIGLVRLAFIPQLLPQHLQDLRKQTGIW